MTWRIALMLLPSLVVGLTLHEFAHAWVASLLGDDFPRRNRRVSLNPFRHLAPLGTLAILFLPFGWARPVPVNPYNFRRPKRDMLLVSLAGPAANLLVAAVCWAVMAAAVAAGPPEGPTGAVLMWVHLYAWLTLIVNVVLAAVNLLPVPPLDGSAIWPLLVPGAPVVRKAKTTWISVALLLVLVYSGGLRAVLTPILSAIGRVLPAAAVAPASPPNEALARAWAAMAGQDFEAAECEFTLAQQLDPENPDTWYGRSLARWQLARYEAAEQDINLALSLDPQNVEYRDLASEIRRALAFVLAQQAFGDGAAAYVQGDHAAAEQAFGEAIELIPDAAIYHYWRAVTRMDQQKWPAALADLDRAIALDAGVPEPFDSRAAVHEHLGHAAEAAADRARAAELRAAASRSASGPSQ